jgi:tetratricopeptide (TPR) repeat protein
MRRTEGGSKKRGSSAVRYVRDHLRVIIAVACLVTAAAWWGWDRVGPAVPVPENLDELDFEVAVLVLEASDALRSRRGNEDLRRQLGLVYEANGLDRYARLCYEQVLDARPDDAMTWYRYGHVCMVTGDSPRAIEAIDRVVELDPTVDSAWAQRGLWRLDATGDEGAEEDFQRALEIDPGNEAAHFGLVLIALDRRKPEEAIARLRTNGLFEGRNTPYAYRLLGNAQRQLGDVEAAEAALARAGSSRPDWHDPWAAELARYRRGVRAMRIRATSLMAGGRHEQALALLQQAAAAEPDNLRIQNTIATCLRKMGRDKECMDLLAAMHARAPKDYWTNLNISESLWALSTSRQVDLDAALHHVDLAIETRPNAGEAYLSKGRTLIALGRTAEAIDVLERAFELDARDPSTLTQAGFLQCDLERWEDARQTFERAVRAEFRSATPVIGLGLAHVGLGDLDRAETLLEEARSRRIDHPAQLARLELAISTARAADDNGEMGETGNVPKEQR